MARERAETSRAALTRQLREREDELEAQRADAAEAFDRIMQQRQEETQARYIKDVHLVGSRQQYPKELGYRNAADVLSWIASSKMSAC